VVANTSEHAVFVDSYSADVGLPAPGGLVATAVSSGRMDLAWVDNSLREDGFAIERSATGTGGWEEIDRVAAGVTVHSDTGLEAGEDYHYRVTKKGSGTNGTAAVFGCCARIL
jgi:hypothetical protein